MAAEWYYTTNKIQMGPVSWTELRELADVGILKPHDMVWTDGMGEWIKAINQDGLFAQEAAEETQSRKKKSAFVEPAKPPPARRSRRREEEDDDDEDDDRTSKKRNRQRDQDRAKAGVGIKVGLIIGGVFFVLVLLACAGGGLIWLSTGGGGAQGGGGVAGPIGPQQFAPFTVHNLPPKKWEEKRYNFRQGKKMVITVNTLVAGLRPDVDLFIHRGNGPGDSLVVEDITIGPNSRVEFFVPANDVYRVRVGNHGPGAAKSSTVTIVEQP